MGTEYNQKTIGAGKAPHSAAAGKKAYRAPVMVCFGAVSEVTQGPSKGVGESTNPGVFKSKAG